jgi:membrane-associated phospholipid phosphatase
MYYSIPCVGRRKWVVKWFLAGATFCFLLIGQCWSSGLDHRLPENTSSIWRRHDVPYYSLLGVSVTGALVLGSEDRLGRTFWKSSEAFLLAQGATEILKRSTGRVRPTETDNPYQWHEGGKSFPSGHVAGSAAMVTPLILEYKEDYPAVWLLAAIPAYEMAARVKTRSHWQTDVIAGALLGVAAGYVQHRSGPFIVRALPDGVFVGFQKKFH